MMDRRAFMTLAGAAGAAPLAGLNTIAHAEAEGVREFYELRRYQVDTEAQKAGLLAFLRHAAIPALNRIAIEPVGVFQPAEELSPVYVLLPHRSLDSVATMTQRLSADEEFMSKGADFLNAPAASPAYARVESSLLMAFTGMPRLEVPSKAATRVFQLRTYESPSVVTGQKKIEMFNTAELAIFRNVGLNAVFFGEALVGEKMPNLTYMLAFDSMDEQKAAWKRFGADPDWQQLRAMPEYADKEILCGITNLSLLPVEGSQL